MNKAAMAAPLFLVLAAVGLVAAQPEDPKIFHWTGDASSAVLEERAALAKWRQFVSRYAVSPTGHVSAVEVDYDWKKSTDGLDINFLSAFSELERLETYRPPARPQAMDGLTKLKRLTYLEISGGVRDEH